MDAIKSYIDHMFKALPATADVKRAKTDLMQMSEDRYQELRDSGVSEHEAVGRVITQFGSLDEVADELGIRAEVDGLPAGDAIEMTDEDAERFLHLNRRASLCIGGGVLAILLGVAALIWMVDASGLGDERGSAFGLIPLFLGIAVGVALFLIGALPLQRFERYSERGILLSPQATDHYRQLRDAQTPWFIASIAGGVAVILLAVLVMTLLPILLGVNPEAEQGSALGIPWAMPLVGIGVLLLITGGMRRDALGRLSREGEFSPHSRENSSAGKLLNRIAGPYWMLAVVVFLSWSFIGDAWNTSWMVWPIAGVTWGLVAVTVNSLEPEEKTRC